MALIISKSGVRRLFGCLASVALTACGGGGSSTPAVVATVTPYPASLVKNTAGLGVLIVQSEGAQVQIEQAFFAPFLQGFVNASTGGSGSGSASCAVAGVGSGSLSNTVTKSGTYSGLRAGDSINLTFTSCSFGTATLVLNGSATITPKNNYASLPAAYLLQYDLKTTNFDITYSGAKFRSTGLQSVTFDATAAGETLPEINVTAGSGGYSSSYFSPAAAVSANLTYALGSGGTIYSKVSAGNNFTYGVNGNVNATSGLSTLPYIIVTNTRLTGNSASGSPVPSAGNVSAKNTALNLQTVTAIQGLNATVQADTNQDGTLDSTTTYSYLALIAP